MADNRSWEEIKKRFGNKIDYEDYDAFFTWAETNIPGGISVSGLASGVSSLAHAVAPVDSNAALTSVLEGYYKTWKGLPNDTKYAVTSDYGPYNAPREGSYDLEQAQALGEDQTGIAMAGQEFELVQTYIRDLTNRLDKEINDGILTEDDATFLLTNVST